MTTKTKKTTIPEQAFSGSWWLVPAFVEVECPRCGKTTWDRPAVSRYKEERDFLDEAKRHDPLWPERGWLVWWGCHACGYEWHSDKGLRHGADNNYATTEDIEQWITEFRQFMKWREH